jgi:hypothetical protein
VARKFLDLQRTRGRVLVENPSLLLVMRENTEITGNLIRHESDTNERRKGDLEMKKTSKY